MLSKVYCGKQPMGDKQKNEKSTFKWRYHRRNEFNALIGVSISQITLFKQQFLSISFPVSIF